MIGLNSEKHTCVQVSLQKGHNVCIFTVKNLVQGYFHNCILLIRLNSENAASIHGTIWYCIVLYTKDTV